MSSLDSRMLWPLYLLWQVLLLSCVADDTLSTKDKLFPVTPCTQAILAAAEYGDEMQLKATLEVEPAGCVDADGRTPLHKAAAANQYGTALILLAAGALMVRDRWGRTPLHAAASSGYANMTGLMLDAGAYVEFGDQVDRRPLHYAARNGHLSVAELLLKKGADVEAQDGDGRRAIHHSAQRDEYINITRYLIEEAYAEVSPMDVVKFTPLHFACFFGQPLTTQLLIGHNGDPFQADITGWSPLIYAASNKFQFLVDWIVVSILKPKAYPPPDPANFIHQNPDKEIVGFPAWLLGVVASLTLTCCFVMPMYWNARRKSNLATPYICDATDQELEVFVNEVFDLALAAGGNKMKMLGKEWDAVPAHTLGDLHRVKNQRGG